ncbi:transcription factor BIM2-like isoform X2 [Chlorella sorokiniana]|uniref:Transcription factor BIM2-like isoform X2 n=1 Tax=Chlorella sorokiniana TaxID=3076 RepID=A0A2P6TLV8_CHLSO|nr:transcription factor BIM2-like isoform X2 [Chlorella sorokiniana]|eukprot:PRW45265.1 transcription factor BIM2-like isoform X2 [Chlorella sorokiniana]
MLPTPQDGQVPGPALEALLQTLGNPMAQLGGGPALPMALGDHPLAHAASAPTSAPASRGRPGRTASDARPASSYNARHQQAEARRRSRINERLEALRQLVPHTERANTANFLEEVVLYVQRLQRRVVELERQLNLPATVQLSSKLITFSDDGATEQTTMLTAGNSDRRAAQSLVQPAMSLPPLPLPQAQMPMLPLPPLPPAQPTLADPAAVQAALAAVLQQHTTQSLQQTLPPALQAQIHQILVQHHAAAAAGAAAAAAVPLHGTAFSHFNLKLQPPPSQVNTQQASQSLAMPAVGNGGQHRTASGGAPAASQPSQANRQAATPAQSSGSGDSRRQSLQLLADSLGALSAGDASLRSVSIPSKAPLGSAGEAPKGGSPSAKRALVDGSGIPTDEELAQLHRDLTAGQPEPQGGGKRQRV